MIRLYMSNNEVYFLRVVNVCVKCCTPELQRILLICWKVDCVKKLHFLVVFVLFSHLPQARGIYQHSQF